MTYDFDEKHYLAGYPGHDSMRAKAERLLGGEISHTEMNMPGSHSSSQREKLRLYKKGGSVHHHDEKEKRRSHLHKLQRHGLHEAETNLEKESHLSRGGHHKRHKHRDKHHKHEIMGGSLTNLHLPKHSNLNIESIHEAQRMKKGGHHVTHKHHKQVHKASGGNIYEHEMLGMHPSHKRPHINYEKDMKGMHCISHAHRKSGEKHGNPGAFDASFGEYLYKGGKVSKGGHKKHHKFAAGGAGKIRHGVMSSSGKPITHKRKMGY